MKKLLLYLVLAVVSVCYVSATGEQLFNRDSSDTDIWITFDLNTYRHECTNFSIDNTTNSSWFQIYIGIDNTNVGNIRSNIYSDNTGSFEPLTYISNGTWIATSALTLNSWNDLNHTADVTFTANTPYWFCVQGDTIQSTDLSWRGSTTAGHQIETSGNGVAPWSSYKVGFAGTLRVWNTSQPSAPAPPSAPEVVDSTVNLTSDGGQICGYNGSLYTICGQTRDTTPTFKWTMNTASDCKLATQPLNYTVLTSSNSIESTNVSGITHTATIPTSLRLAPDFRELYIACKSEAGVQSGYPTDADVFNLSISMMWDTILLDELGSTVAIDKNDLLGYANATRQENITSNVSFEYRWYKNDIKRSESLLPGKPLHYYNFDSQYMSGASVLDYMRGYNGLQDKTISTSGVFGSALFFDNNSKTKVDFPLGGNFSDSNSTSFGAWIYPSSTNGSIRQVVTRQRSALNRAYELRILANGSAQCGIMRAGDGAVFRGFSNSVVAANTWQHVLCTYQHRPTPSTGSIIVYINGTVDSNTSIQFFAPMMPTSTSNLSIGWRRMNNDQYFNGSIDEVVIYDYPLTPAQVMNISNGTVNKVIANYSRPYAPGIRYLLDIIPDNETTIGDNWTFSARTFTVNLTFDDWLNSSVVTIGDYFIDNCSVYDIYALNISFLDENDIATLVDFEATISYWLQNESDARSFSYFVNNINKTQICINHDFLNLTSNFQIRYTDSENIIYDYFTFHTDLNNDTSELILYTQNQTSQVLFTVQTINTNPIEDVYIHVLKYDVGTNTYTTTEILKTDSQGQAIGNIILATTFYNFLLFFQGELVYTEQSVKVIGTTRTFTIDLEGIGWFNDFETTLGVTTDLYYNNASQNFVYTFSDPGGTIHQACLRVDKKNDSGKFNLSNNCVTSTSGSIIYNIAPLHNGTEYTGIGYLKYDNEIITDVVVHIVESVRSFFRTNPVYSLFIAFMFCLALLMIGIPNPALSLSLFGIGIIFSSIFGLYVISSLQLGSIIVLILIQLYLAGRQTT